MRLKLQLLLRRIRGFDFARLGGYIDNVKKESRVPRPLIFIDMLFCILLYNVGFFDYYIFGFVHFFSPKKRRTYFTMKDNWRLSRLVNTAEDKPFFANKLKFCDEFRAFLGRETMNVEKATPEEITAFLARHPVVFLKPTDGFGGIGIERFDARGRDLGDLEFVAALRVQWCTRGLLLAEEAVVQHPALARLYGDALNTMRVCTLTDDAGVPHLIYCYLRTGVGGSFVDNTTSGGLSALVCLDGTIRKPALSDKTGEYFDAHPDTGVPFIGFELPYFEEALTLCCRAARIRPGMRYVGWDIGFTAAGPVLIEGNDLPAYDGQIYRQTETPGTGLKPRIRSIVPEL